EKAKNLPYGQQRRLEIVRALATEPKILFLDEPAAGMNPNETANLTELIRQIQKDFDITVVLIEHDMSLVMNVCERIYVLEYGKLIAHGTPSEIQSNPAVIKAYLGGEQNMTMLEVKDLKVSYGMIEAIKGISFEVNQGEIVSLIGSNGAGKSTTLRTISGIKPAKSGQILYEGQDILKSNAMKIVKAGISQVPEGRHVFKGMSVKENLLMGAYTRKDRDGLKEDMEKSFEYFPIIKERLNQDAATLSGGEQQMVAMARALMAKPKLLLLDEPSMGLAPLFIQQIFNIIEEINAAGTTVLLIEQNAKQALSISDRAYVMETGKILLSGTGQELLTSDKVQEAYLGRAMV